MAPKVGGLDAESANVVARTWRAVTETVVEATRRARNARRIRVLCARHAGCSYHRDMHTRRSLVSLLLALSLLGCTPSRSVDRGSLDAASDVSASPTLEDEAIMPTLGSASTAVQTTPTEPVESIPEPEPVAPHLERMPVAEPSTALGERPGLARDEDEWGPFLRVHGLPALRPDGRAVLTVAGSDVGSAELRVLDVDTGELIERWPYPAQTEDAWEEDPVSTVDAALLRRTERRIARAGYRALAQLPLVEELAQDGERRTTFALGELRVTAHIAFEADNVLEITIADADGVRVLPRGEGDHLDGVSIAPDGSFLVLDESFCACECNEWSRVVTLSPGA